MQAANATVVAPPPWLAVALWASLAVFAVAAVYGFMFQATAAWPFAAGSRAALLVIAHPDDEAMFFVPTAAALQRAGWRLHILCLSTGSGGGDGKVRSRELVTSAAALHVPEDRVILIDRPELPDTMDPVRGRWNPELVRAIVGTAVVDHGVDMVLSFDAHGVSGHPNHVATYHGVRLYAQHPAAAPCYALDTVFLLRKFTSLLDIPLSLLSHALKQWIWPAPTSCLPRRVVVTYPTVALSVACMQAHASQFVWFRKLFVYFARYPFINTFTALKDVAVDHLTHPAADEKHSVNGVAGLVEATAMSTSARARGRQRAGSATAAKQGNGGRM